MQLIWYKGNQFVTSQHQSGDKVTNVSSLLSRYLSLVTGSLVGYLPISDRLIVERLNVKPHNITVIQLYGPTTAATEEEMESLYQDLSRAFKQVPKGHMLLVMGDFNAKVSRRERSAMSSKVGLYGLEKRMKPVSS